MEMHAQWFLQMFFLPFRCAFSPAFPVTVFDQVTVFLAAPSFQVKLRVAVLQNFFFVTVGFKFITSGSLHLKIQPTNVPGCYLGHTEGMAFCFRGH